jgi:hypothetical protein
MQPVLRVGWALGESKAIIHNHGDGRSSVSGIDSKQALTTLFTFPLSTVKVQLTTVPRQLSFAGGAPRSWVSLLAVHGPSSRRWVPRYLVPLVSPLPSCLAPRRCRLRVHKRAVMGGLASLRDLASGEGRGEKREILINWKKN